MNTNSLLPRELKTNDETYPLDWNELNRRASPEDMYIINFMEYNSMSFKVCECGNNIFLVSISNNTLVYKCTHCGRMEVVTLDGNVD